MGTGGGLVVIDFSAQGNSAHFRRQGWSGQEPDRVWGIGPRSVLRVPVQSSGWTMMLEAEIAPGLAPPVITGQIVRVRINGTAIGGVRLNYRSMIRCEINPALARPDGILEIDFEFPGFFRAAALFTSADDRPLSAWFSFVRVYTTDMFKPGPHFPSTRPDIPVVGLSLPAAEVPRADTKAAPVVYTFGPTGTGKSFLRDGWIHADDGLAWIAAFSSEIELPALVGAGPYVLRLDVQPMILPGTVRTREVTLALDRNVIGQLSLDEPTTWIVPLPGELITGLDGLPLTFLPPDATEHGGFGPAFDISVAGIAISRATIIPLPSHLAAIENVRAEEGGPAVPVMASARFLGDDIAALSGTIEAATGMDTVSLMRGFESLGPNREFGIVQGKLGHEVVNLFRCCDGTLPDLLRALTDDLKAAADPGSIAIERNDADPPEYVVGLAGYNLHWPVAAPEKDANQETMWRTHASNLGYLRRKFYEGLRAGRKIYVLNQRRRVPIGQAVALLLELNRFGRATLLIVEPASPGRRPGEVELIMPSLMRGYVERLIPGSNAEYADPADWLRVTANATLLTREPILGSSP